MDNDKDIFKKFSENSRKVLVSSQKIAQSTSSAINSQHMLLALAVTPGTLAYSILLEHMISLDQIRLVISLQGIKNKNDKNGLSPEGRKVLEKAFFWAKNFHHNTIDPEHILLSIVTLEGCLGYEIIARVGSEPSVIRRQIEELFQDIEDIDFKNLTPPPANQPPMPWGQAPMMPPSGYELPMTEQAVMPPQQIKNVLEYYTVDLTAQARDGKNDPLIGRGKELERVIQILSRRTKNNPVLVGEPGVGKTAIVEGLAEKIIHHQVPQTIADKKIIMLDLALLVAGTMYRGQFEDRLKKVMEELEKQGNIMLFVDELHTIVGAGSAEGSLDAANILKPALAKGKIRLIGATTLEEYRKVIEKDPALERRLQKVNIEEPTPHDTIEILRGLRPKYEEYHHVKITDEALESAVNLSRRYISDRYLPDKAIDLVDEAAAAYFLHKEDKEVYRTKHLEQQLALVKTQKDNEVNNQNYQKAAELRDLEIRLSEEIRTHQQNHVISSETIITPTDIAKVVSLWTNVPVENISKTDRQKLLHLENILKQYIVGQDEAVQEIAQALRRRKSGISDPNRPIGSFIFLGPTGVGKTELARVLAQELFGNREAIIKIDMSEFMERHSVSRLIGAPPGYVGYDEAGKLTEEVRRRPYSILLFDEIEKAHPEVFNILLQILEDGQLTDARGKHVNFRNTMVILTSNIGTNQLNRQAAIGFQAKGPGRKKANDEFEKMKNEITNNLKQEFRPEFINRLDNIIVFRPLDQSDITKIINLNLKQLAERLQPLGFKLEFDRRIDKLIMEKGYDPNYGARPVRRAISDLIEDPLSEAILANAIKKGDKVKFFVKDHHIIFSVKKYRQKPALKKV
ncbi:MAG: ATP-dependent Clp protease ATP-binding subunit [Patescibacteria group bacterium]|jgi:ATP-dependent Clp protease ATP-binding subunit ClpC